MRFSLEAQKRGPAFGSPREAAGSASWARYDGQTSASLEIRDADIYRGQSLSVGGTSPTPVLARQSKDFEQSKGVEELTTMPSDSIKEAARSDDDDKERTDAVHFARNALASDGQFGDDVDSERNRALASSRAARGSRSSPHRSKRTLSAADQPLSSHKNSPSSKRAPQRLVDGGESAWATRSQEALQALWNSCQKAAAQRQEAAPADSGGGRSVRCSLLESMNSAARQNER